MVCVLQLNKFLYILILIIFLKIKWYLIYILKKYNFNKINASFQWLIKLIFNEEQETHNEFIQFKK